MRRVGTPCPRHRVGDDGNKDKDVPLSGSLEGSAHAGIPLAEPFRYEGEHQGVETYPFLLGPDHETGKADFLYCSSASPYFSSAAFESAWISSRISAGSSTSAFAPKQSSHLLMSHHPIHPSRSRYFSR